MLLAGAADRRPVGPTIDVDDPAFIPPGRHAGTDRGGGRATGRATEPETVRCILDSLAAAYARTVERAAALAGTTVDVIHIVGGGSQNELLCQLTADAAGRPGGGRSGRGDCARQRAVQARSARLVPASLEAIRVDIANMSVVRRYDPS